MISKRNRFQEKQNGLSPVEYWIKAVLIYVISAEQFKQTQTLLITIY